MSEEHLPGSRGPKRDSPDEDDPLAGRLRPPFTARPSDDGPEPERDGRGGVATEEPWPDRPEGWRHDAPDPPDSFAVPFSWTDGVVLVAIFLVVSAVLGTVLALAGIDITASAARIAAVAGGSQLVSLGVSLLWLRHRGALTWHILGPVRPRWRHVGIGLGAGVAGWLGVTLLMAIVVLAIDREELPGQESLELLATGDVLGIVLGVVSVVFIAAVYEEVVYRGVFFQALRHRLGLFPGMGISSFVWGLMHMELFIQPGAGFEPAGLIPVLGIVVFSFWLCGVLHRTGSLVVPIVAHAVFNGIAFTIAIVFGGV